MSKEKLFASFIVDQQSGVEIALPASQVVEAVPLAAHLAPLPTAAPFLEGIMHLRQESIPVINLKKRLGLNSPAYGQEAKVAVIRFNRRRYGLLVDDIRDVLRVPAENIEPLDPFLLSPSSVFTDLITLDQGRRTLELMDVQRLFTDGATMIDNLAIQEEERTPVQRVYSRYVLYSCLDQVYGLPVSHAREICFYADLDQTFKSGKVEGALQLRGATIPVLCSAALLGCSQENRAPTEETRILVMQADQLSFGLIVDKVHQILVKADDEVMPIPGGHLPHLKGVCSTERFPNVMLLDVLGLVSSQAERINAMARLGNGADERRQMDTLAGSSRHIITEHCFLVFTIGRHYAIELKDVQEIIDCGDLMTIQAGSGLVQGIINLRGRIVPVIDLRSFYQCTDQSCAFEGAAKASKLIIGRAGGNLVALLVDEIVTIYKEEQSHQTPSLRKELQARQDTLDRLIEFINQEGLKEHVLVVNVGNLLRNHLGIPDQAVADPVPALADAAQENHASTQS